VFCLKSNVLINGKIQIVLFPRKYTWTKESRTLKRKLEKRGNNDNKIKDFYWKRDMKINSIKAEFYDKNKFEETSNFIKLCYEYPDLSYDFYWLLRTRSGYRLDARITKAAKIINLFKRQMKSGVYSDTPFLVTEALLQTIISIVISQQWSLFNRFKSNRTNTTKSANAEETVRQASRASATNEDQHIIHVKVVTNDIVLIVLEFDLNSDYLRSIKEMDQ